MLQLNLSGSYIQDMDFDGYGLSYVDNKMIKVKGVVAGQKVKVKINEGIVKKLLDEAGIDEYEFLGIEGGPDVFAYRNKMEYIFGKDNKGNLKLGLHKKGRFYDIVTTRDCRIVDNDFAKCIGIVLNFAEKYNLPVYNGKTHEGYLRHMVVRKAAKSVELLVNIVTTSQNYHDFLELVEILKGADFKGKLVSILHTINDSLSDAVICEKLIVLYGRDYFIEDILGLKFKISAFSFFLTNSKGAEKLYSIAREFAGDLS